MTVAERNRFLEAEEELARELEKYAGKWVAVREQSVVAHADTPETLLEQVDAEQIEGIFRVPEKGVSALL